MLAVDPLEKEDLIVGISVLELPDLDDSVALGRGGRRGGVGSWSSCLWVGGFVAFAPLR